MVKQMAPRKKSVWKEEMCNKGGKLSQSARLGWSEVLFSPLQFRYPVIVCTSLLSSGVWSFRGSDTGGT